MATPRQRCRPDAETSKTLLQLAWPLVLSNSFWTLQITLDRILLSRHSSDAVGASMAASMLFWTPLTLFQFTANYATTFVAQYIGAGQHRRVGAAVWQAIWFSFLGGLAFLALAPFSEALIALGKHSPELQRLEAPYFRCLCFAALPTLLTASATSFFTGRSASRIVLFINAIGLAVNVVLAYALIFGEWGLPELGIVGAGWATVAGMSTSALLGLGLMLLKEYRDEFATLSAWRLEWPLFVRMMRYGLPSGIGVSFDVLAFTLFTWLVGWLGSAALAATTIAFTLNLLVYMPMMGLAQAVSVLVGQRLGEDQPDAAERATWTGLALALLFTGAVGLVYLIWPDQMALLFRSQENVQSWDRVAELVPMLLRFIVVYCLFDSVNLVLSFALRGAGDTRFVTAVSLALSWPVMVLPTWLVCACSLLGGGLHWAWTFASGYIMLLALTYLWRFLQGKWREMRVIESPAPELDVSMPERPSFANR
jgi:MATE family multidrug resistance protein